MQILKVPLVDLSNINSQIEKFCKEKDGFYMKVSDYPAESISRNQKYVRYKYAPEPSIKIFHLMGDEIEGNISIRNNENKTRLQSKFYFKGFDDKVEINYLKEYTRKLIETNLLARAFYFYEESVLLPDIDEAIQTMEAIVLMDGFNKEIYDMGLSIALRNFEEKIDVVREYEKELLTFLADDLKEKSQNELDDFFQPPKNFNNESDKF